jgi:hypothetical protein
MLKRKSGDFQNKNEKRNWTVKKGEGWEIERESAMSQLFNGGCNAHFLLVSNSNIYLEFGYHVLPYRTHTYKEHDSGDIWNDTSEGGALPQKITHTS